MAIQTIPGGLWIPPPPSISGVGAPTLTAEALSASNHRVAFVIECPETGTLDSWECKLGTVSNTPDNGMRVSFQDISASDGNPDGTQDQYCDITSGFTTAAWLTPPHALTNDGTGGGTKRSVTAGDRLGCVMEFVSFTTGDSLEIASFTQAGVGTKGLPDGNCYVNRYTGTWGTKSANAPVMALKYSTGAYYPILPWVWPIAAINTRTFNSGSSPPRRGLRFQVPVPARFAGAWVRLDLDNDVDVVLYDGSDNVLSSVTLKSASRSSASGQNFSFHMPKVTLSANTTYRLVAKPAAVTNVSFYDFTINSSGLLAAMEGGAQWYTTTGTTGSWTDTNTNRPVMGVLFDGFDDGAGAGTSGYSRGRVVNS